MMIVRGPQGFSGGKVIDAPVSHLDVYPTLCELAGAEAPSWLGVGSMPLVRGELDRLHDAVFAETTPSTRPMSRSGQSAQSAGSTYLDLTVLPTRSLPTAMTATVRTCS